MSRLGYLGAGVFVGWWLCFLSGLVAGKGIDKIRIRVDDDHYADGCDLETCDVPRVSDSWWHQPESGPTHLALKGQSCHCGAEEETQHG